MSLSSRITKAVYVPDGVQTLYAVPFPLFSERDVECWAVNDAGLVTAISNFTVEGYGTQSGVHVRFATAPVAGGSLVVRRNTRQVQESTYPEGGKFPSLVVENDFDRIVGMVQELNEAVDRSLKVNVSEESPPESAEELYARVVETLAEAGDKAAEAAGSAGEAADSANRAEEDAALAQDQAALAVDSAEMARKWAENPEDAPVIDEHYSAYHWAKKALENASSGVNLSDALDGARKAGDGVGASEWALAEVNAQAGAAQATADAALPKTEYAAHQAMSGQEWDTGETWIDGRKIYAQVIDIGALPNATGKYVPVAIANFDRIVPPFIGLAYPIALPQTGTIPLPTSALPFVGVSQNVYIFWQ
ncbi:hypothetical protein LJC15_03370, partial [Desulfovibrio sp. OttesenSCG-928-G11]|nr:hypothetical protein [Desulfovibrio sp. OttesenSCG-928-G11]